MSLQLKKPTIRKMNPNLIPIKNNNLPIKLESSTPQLKIKNNKMIHSKTPKSAKPENKNFGNPTIFSFPEVNLPN
jgi:hypothetical protein